MEMNHNIKNTCEAEVPDRESKIEKTAGKRLDPENHSIQLLCGLLRTIGKTHQIVARDKRTEKFKHTPVKGAIQAFAGALAISDSGLDAYFACAEYNTPKKRTAANASGACAFWMDVDCGDSKAASGKGYVTCDSAQQAYEHFCKETGLPLPTHIVGSGGGLHIYWVLDRVLCREDWLAYARKFKALAQKLGFLADPTRTADIASILRVPGTLNHKYDPPKPVVLLHSAADFIEQPVMLAAIDAAHARFCTVAASPRSTVPARTRIQHDTGGQNSRIRSIDSGNLRLLETVLLHLDADCGYYDWFRVGAAIFHATSGSDDGFALYDAWSSTGRKYGGVLDVRTKWQSFNPDHPRPVNMATLRSMVHANGHDWFEVCAAAEDDFDFTGDDATEGV